MIDIGVFVSTEKTISPTDKKNVEPKENKTTTTTISTTTTSTPDYSTKVETAMSNAIAAFDDGRFADAFKYYTDAANYPTERSSSIKQNAAKKFKEKAERLMAINNGECDEVSKQLLKYANSLNPSSEIQRLLNKCN